MSRSELSRTSVAFLYFFTVITSYYVLRAIRTGEFLSFIGPTRKPWADILVALLMLPCLRGYHVLVDRLPRRRFIALSQTVLAAQLLGFGALLIVSTPTLAACLGRLGELFSLRLGLSVIWDWLAAVRGVWSSAMLYVWVAIFNLFMVTMCWSAINDVFREGAARRRYGIISAGGPLGGMAGGSLTAIFVGRIQPGGMLLVSAFFVFVCVGLGHLLLSMRDDESSGPDGDGVPESSGPDGDGVPRERSSVGPRRDTDREDRAGCRGRGTRTLRPAHRPDRRLGHRRGEPLQLPVQRARESPRARAHGDDRPLRFSGHGPEPRGSLHGAPPHALGAEALGTGGWGCGSCPGLYGFALPRPRRHRPLLVPRGHGGSWRAV